DEVRTVLAAYTLGSNVENLAFTGSGSFAGTGNALANVITGGSGNDVLIGGAGSDRLDGGNGNDTASYATSSAAVTVNLTTGVNAGGDAAGDTLVSIENLTGSAYADSLTGNAGNNILDGGTGNDSLAGGAGDDIYYVDVSTDVISEAVNGGVDEVRSTSSNYTLSANVENLTYIGTSTFTGSGNASNNVITGGSNADVLYGYDGNDTLNGGDGNDVLIGGAGADILNGGNGIDRASYASSSSSVWIDLTRGIHTGDAAGDVFNSIEIIEGGSNNDSITGDAADNEFWGGAGIDGLFGGAGNDILNGGADNDTLKGGLGADKLDGGTGVDWAHYGDSSAAVTVNLATGINTGGDAEGDTLTSIENLYGSAYADTLTGDANANYIRGAAGDDVLNGGAGNDTLEGDDGNDILIGGTGNDLLNGGTGSDTFHFDLSFGHDTVEDFSTGDVMEFANSVFTDFSDMLSAATEINGNTIITFDGDNSVTLQHVALASLSADEFRFVA
ncbi:MAG: hypothetical protein H6R00_2480, partial [Proteobacteria bacterium]|nr:hypothetical protein [Pseudomonadota bacterium]